MQYNIAQYKGATFSSVAKGFGAFLAGNFAQNSSTDILYILEDGTALADAAAEAAYLYPDLQILKFPAWDTVPYDRTSPNPAIVAQRIACLAELVSNPTPKKPRLILTSVGAVLQKLPPQKIFLNSMREVSVGNKLNFDDFLHYAAVNGYTRTAQVFEPGEFAVRGDIIDIFPTGTDEPLRIDLFDDEV